MLKNTNTKSQLIYAHGDQGIGMIVAKTVPYTGELGYDGPLYNGFLHMADDMLGPSPMHIKYLSYIYDRFCI